VSKKLIASVKEVQRQRLGDMLINEDAKGNIFKIAKQMVKKNKDVVGARCMKDVDGIIVVDNEKIMEVWKRYYEEVMNEEFDWDKDNLEIVRLICVGPCRFYVEI